MSDSTSCVSVWSKDPVHSFSPREGQMHDQAEGSESSPALLPGTPPNAPPAERTEALLPTHELRELLERGVRKAFRIVQNMQDAEDVAHDAYLKALRSFRPERGSFSFWYMRATRSLSLDIVRHRKRRKAVDLFPPAGKVMGAEGLALVRDPEDEQALMMRLRIEKALVRLPARFRDMLEKYREGYSIYEIAVQLGVHRSTVHRTWQQAVAALQEVLLTKR
ncbi:MAG TPA: RNA polymerase sigma factor [Longimicrobiaceae bacterium]|nr:RNA polymerase sigma factor [Longimicrobiaceae bacterium]